MLVAAIAVSTVILTIVLYLYGNLENTEAVVASSSSSDIQKNTTEEEQPLNGTAKAEDTSTTLVQSVLENAKAIVDWCLKLAKNTDKTTGTLVFVGAYFLLCASLIFINTKWPYLCSKKKSKRTRKAKDVTAQPVEGKQSARLRLLRHELQFISKITPEQFE